MEQILSSLVFALNSVLLTGFIIPQVHKLKEIKDKLIKFDIATVDTKGKKSEEEQKQNVETLQKWLDVYRIRSNELNKLVKIFYLSIGVALLSVVFYKLCLNTEAVALLHALVQFGILVFAIKTYAISPNRLQEADYLVREMDVNPHSLLQAIDLELSIDFEGEENKKQKREDPLVINLIPKVRVLGFRFLLIISDEKGKVYHISFGPIDAKTHMWRQLIPPSEFWGGELNVIGLGKFPFNMVKEKQWLNISLLIFLSFFKHEKVHPKIINGQYETEGEKSTMLISSATVSSSSPEPFREIEFQGEGTKIFHIKLLKEEHVISKVAKKHLSEIAETKKIVEYGSVTGDLI